MTKAVVELARRISNEKHEIYALAGILTFTDKIIDKEFAEYVKGVIMMTKVAQLIFDEGIEKGLTPSAEYGADVC